MVAPTARKTLQLDHLLATTDNRVIVAHALDDLVPADSSLYRSGEKYGYVPMKIDGHDIARISDFDVDSGQFESGEPDWILLQRSPLVFYSPVAPQLDQLSYTTDTSSFGDSQRAAIIPAPCTDQQDAFFLPLEGLGGITPRAGVRAVPARIRAANAGQNWQNRVLPRHTQYGLLRQIPLEKP